MAPLSNEIRPISSCTPQHIGPAIPEVPVFWSFCRAQNRMRCFLILNKGLLQTRKNWNVVFIFSGQFRVVQAVYLPPDGQRASIAAARQGHQTAQTTQSVPGVFCVCCHTPNIQLSASFRCQVTDTAKKMENKIAGVRQAVGDDVGTRPGCDPDLQHLTHAQRRALSLRNPHPGAQISLSRHKYSI